MIFRSQIKLVALGRLGQTEIILEKSSKIPSELDALLKIIILFKK